MPSVEFWAFVGSASPTSWWLAMLLLEVDPVSPGRTCRIRSIAEIAKTAVTTLIRFRITMVARPATSARVSGPRTPEKNKAITRGTDIPTRVRLLSSDALKQHTRATTKKDPYSPGEDSVEKGLTWFPTLMACKDWLTRCIQK